MSSEIAPVQRAQQMTVAEQMSYAGTVCKGSLVPQAYRNSPANVLIAMDFGRSMGLSPAESLYRITVINGKPTASAELIASNVRRAGHRLRVEKDEAAMAATATITRADDPDFTYRATWDMAKAERAGLAGKGNWRTYPMAMLAARAITEVARDACPEALYGVVYTGEEMGAERTDEQGAAEAAAPGPVPVEAAAEPAVDLTPVRRGFKAYCAAAGLTPAEGTRAICGELRISDMHEMDSEQVLEAVEFMRAEVERHAARARADAQDAEAEAPQPQPVADLLGEF